MRGEGPGGACSGPGDEGRSPRARGRRRPPIPRVPINGSIPACAGKADTIDDLAKALEVDPRVRGEGLSQRWDILPSAGRSPRARGRRRPRPLLQTKTRSIPACAGKASHWLCPPPGRWVDPRVRGEGARRRVCAGLLWGRSPRARGRLPVRRFRRSLWGSIPACAGKAIGNRSSGWGDRVDPRVRGEGLIVCASSNQAIGRSPRARGRRKARKILLLCHGSIPACAGKATAHGALVTS